MGPNGEWRRSTRRTANPVPQPARLKTNKPREAETVSAALSVLADVVERMRASVPDTGGGHRQSVDFPEAYEPLIRGLIETLRKHVPESALLVADLGRSYLTVKGNTTLSTAWSGELSRYSRSRQEE